MDSPPRCYGQTPNISATSTKQPSHGQASHPAWRTNKVVSGTMPKRRRSSAASLPAQDIIELMPNDVLFGRGDSINRHPGNKTFRDLVDSHKRVYLAARFKQEKRMIANGIMSTIAGLNPSGRFLAKDSTTGRWQVVSDARAKEKTLQALREKARSARTQGEADAALRGAENTAQSMLAAQAAAPQPSVAQPLDLQSQRPLYARLPSVAAPLPAPPANALRARGHTSAAAAPLAGSRPVLGQVDRREPPTDFALTPRPSTYHPLGGPSPISGGTFAALQRVAFPESPRLDYLLGGGLNQAFSPRRLPPNFSVAFPATHSPNSQLPRRLGQASSSILSPQQFDRARQLHLASQQQAAASYRAMQATTNDNQPQLSPLEAHGFFVGQQSSYSPIRISPTPARGLGSPSSLYGASPSLLHFLGTPSRGAAPVAATSPRGIPLPRATLTPRTRRGSDSRQEQES